MSLNALLTNLESSKYPQSTMMRLLLVGLLFTAAVSAVSKHGRRKHYLVEIEDEVGRIYLHFYRHHMIPLILYVHKLHL